MNMTRALEDAAEKTARDFVLDAARLGLPDESTFRRPHARATEFEVELLEVDGDASAAVIHAAGPVTLETAAGSVEKFLRVSIPTTLLDGAFLPIANSDVRAVFVEDVGNPNGGCKEVMAFARD